MKQIKEHELNQYDLFQSETNKILKVNLNERVWAKAGSMIAYEGNIRFEREGILEHGLGKMFKKALTGEGASLMKAEGNGSLFLADQGKQVHIIQLEGDSLSVNGNDVLAFDPKLKWDIRFMRKVAGMMAGGLFNVTFEGNGLVAITSHGRPMTIEVTPNKPIFTDPNATVAWSGHLQPSFKTDVQLKTFFGRGSGESIQMMFQGEGFVIVQPYEEVYYMQQTSF